MNDWEVVPVGTKNELDAARKKIGLLEWRLASRNKGIRRIQIQVGATGVEAEHYNSKLGEQARALADCRQECRSLRAAFERVSEELWRRALEEYTTDKARGRYQFYTFWPGKEGE